MSFLLQRLVSNLGYIILIAFVVSRLKSFKKIMQKDKYQIKDIIVLSFVFGTFGIIGTYIGTKFEGAIANNRIVGIMAGGILCGPFVGITGAIIAAAHRFIIDVHGITTIPCCITTISTGIISGFIYKRNINKKYIWVYACLLSVLMESFEMFLIIMISKPYSKALFIVQNIYVPMVIANALGASMVILLIQNIFNEKENIEAKQAKITLDIANETLPYFRQFNVDSLEKICTIIMKYIKADAVAITNKEYILTHVGAGSEHHVRGNKILTKATKQVIKDGKVQIIEHRDKIGCPYKECPLKSAIITPIKDKNEIIGTFKVYYVKENSITFKNKSLVLGLSKIISTQLEISKVERFKQMANEAEIKVLQSQINPHFLFNVLNTVASFIHINPDKARELLVNLSEYLRYNLDIDKTFVDIDKEIEHIKRYVKIEKARFGDKINVIYKIDDDIDIKVPNLIIQPIVENSIKHGILKQEGKGSIKIEIKKVNKDRIKVCVEDDGKGIEQSIIDMVYNSNKMDNNVGLLNVNNRLKHLYGNSLKIQKLKKGTRVSFFIDRLEDYN